MGDTCSLCKKEKEDTKHLFFECDFSQYLWKKACLKMNHGRATSSPLMEQIIASMCYYVWQERNMRVHGGRKEK